MSYLDPSTPRELFGWKSPRLDLEMPIVRYGNWGHALILFPTAQADFLENERFYLIKAIEPLIAAGRLQVFSIDSINRFSWMNREISIPEKARRQALYSGYVEDEVVPHIRRVLGDPSARIAVAGASFGAFHAANAFFRRPDLFDTLVGMSGLYDLRPDYLHEFMNDEAYYNNPASFLEHLSDHGILESLRHSTIHIVTGQGRWEHPESSRRFSRLLSSKAIAHNLDLWGHDVDHDWPWWRRMLPYYLGERVGF